MAAEPSFKSSLGDVARRLGERGRSHTSQGRARLHAPVGQRPDSVRSPAPSAAALPPSRPTAKRRTPRVLLAVRYVLPALIIIAGAIALAFGTVDSFYGGVSLIGAGLSVALFNWVYRVGARGDADRDAEDQARRYFDRFGRWPDQTR